MLAAIYLTLMGCVAGVAWALMAEPSVRLSGTPELAGTLGKRRSVSAWLLGLLGRFPAPGGQATTKKAEPLYAGSRMTHGEFQGIKIVAAGGAAFAALSLQMSGGGLKNPSMLVLAAGIGWMAPNFWLRSRIAARKQAIVRLLPDVFDLLTVCIGAGMDFLNALQKVVALQELEKEPLIEELRAALQEIKLGKRRADALKAMAKRVEMPEVTSFVRTLVQADRMGTPIAQVLAIHADDVRMQRFVRAERLALQAPMKILVPLIFFIMPCVAIIVAAPIFLQFMRQTPFGQ